MKHWHEEMPFTADDSLAELIFTENSLFFDIETTGFSAARTSLYLIGCAARKENLLIVDQFFAETPADESDVLHAFLDYLQNFDTIITFNGIGFDIPYLTNKCQKYKIPEPFSAYEYVDIYKMISGFRFLFALPNLKQKTVEQFIGLEREDAYNGGELIDVYKACQKNPDKKLISLLKQHNYEDVIDMPKLLSVLSYVKLFEGGFNVTSVCANESVSYDGKPCREILFSMQNIFPVPKRVSCHYEDFHLVHFYTTRTLAEAFLAACDKERMESFTPLFTGSSTAGQAALAALLPNTFLQALVWRTLTASHEII